MAISRMAAVTPPHTADNGDRLRNLRYTWSHVLSWRNYQGEHLGEFRFTPVRDLELYVELPCRPISAAKAAPTLRAVVVLPNLAGLRWANCVRPAFFNQERPVYDVR